MAGDGPGIGGGPRLLERADGDARAGTSRVRDGEDTVAPTLLALSLLQTRGFPTTH